MVGLKQIRDYLQQRLDADKKQRYVNVSGDNLQDALKQASIELSTSIKKIEYEILDPGSGGMMGVGKKPCCILAYPANSRVLEKDESLVEDSFDINFEMDGHQAGRIFIRKNVDSVLMKISVPEGDGPRVNERMALNALNEKNVVSFDKLMVSKLVKKADNMWVKIADLRHDPTQDAQLSIKIQDMEMSAYLTISPAGERGADPDKDFIMSFLQKYGIVHGYIEDIIADLADNPVYSRPVLVAEGSKPKNGENGKVLYNFEIQTDSIRLKEIDGKVDFKELNNINNVVAGQVLAKVIKPTAAEPGQSVTGKFIPAEPGEPCQMEVGNNVRLSDDELTAISEINGQVIIVAGKMSVEPVYVVNSGVDLQTGNILFLGTVIVNGNVEDGFSVKAAGNIEITGSVGKCEIDAEGDVIIRQGMNGRESGLIHSGGNVYAKFIQNTHVESVGMVVVSNGIINSNVSSDKKILCKGKRASIVGGNLRAVEEINAKTLGSVANMKTILEVGFDPKSKEKFDLLQKEEREISERLDELSKDVNRIEQAIKLKRKLPKDRMQKYKIFKTEQMDLQTRVDEIEDEKAEVHSYLAELKANGKVSASAMVFPGVKVSIKDATLEVRNEFKAVTFVNENGMVKVSKYEEIEDDISMKPKERV